MPGFSLFFDFKVFREKNVTQGSIGRGAPRYPPKGPGLYKKVKFLGQDNLSLAIVKDLMTHYTGRRVGADTVIFIIGIKKFNLYSNLLSNI